MRVAAFVGAVAVTVITVILHIVFTLGAAVMAAVVGSNAGSQQQRGGGGEQQSFEFHRYRPFFNKVGFGRQPAGERRAGKGFCNAEPFFGRR